MTELSGLGGLVDRRDYHSALVVEPPRNNGCNIFLGYVNIHSEFLVENAEFAVHSTLSDHRADRDREGMAVHLAEYLKARRGRRRVSAGHQGPDDADGQET